MQEGGNGFVRGAPGVTMARPGRAAVAKAGSAGLRGPGQTHARRQEPPRGQQRSAAWPGRRRWVRPARAHAQPCARSECLQSPGSSEAVCRGFRSALCLCMLGKGEESTCTAALQASSLLCSACCTREGSHPWLIFPARKRRK